MCGGPVGRRHDPIKDGSWSLEMSDYTCNLCYMCTWMWQWGLRRAADATGLSVDEIRGLWNRDRD